MNVFSFFREIKENSNSKKIIVSFDSTVEGYEIIDKKGNIELVGMDTHKCKLKHFENEVKKITKKAVYKQSPEVNGLINLSLDFRPNKVLISGEKVILKKIDISGTNIDNNFVHKSKENTLKHSSSNQQSHNNLNNKKENQPKDKSYKNNQTKRNHYKKTSINSKSNNNKNRSKKNRKKKKNR